MVEDPSKKDILFIILGINLVTFFLMALIGLAIFFLLHSVFQGTIVGKSALQCSSLNPCHCDETRDCPSDYRCACTAYRNCTCEPPTLLDSPLENSEPTPD